MSEISTAIHSYRAGRTTWQHLFDYLTKRKFPEPERYKNASANPFVYEMETENFYTDGTWDEVRRAMSFGWLTYPEYDAINQARWRLYPKPDPARSSNYTGTTPRDPHGMWAGGGGYGPMALTGDEHDFWQRSPTVKDVVKKAEGFRPYNDDGKKDSVLDSIAKEKGFDGQPRLVSEEELGSLVNEQGWTEGWRGTKPEYAEQFKTGEYFSGQGIYGNGTYVASDRSMAETFAITAGGAGPDGNGPGMLHMAVSPDAKMIDIGELHTQMRETNGALEAASALEEFEPSMTMSKWRPIRDQWASARSVLADEGRYAALKGYDGVVMRDGEQLLILNRSKVAVVK